jgi:hypothetical protein
MAKRPYSLSHVVGCSLLAALLGLVPGQIAHAQDQPQGPWENGVTLRGAIPPSNEEAGPGDALATVTVPSNTTVVPRTGTPPPEANAPAQVNLVALLTADGQRIDQGLSWRVYQEAPGKKGQPKLLMTKTDASPTLSLKPGEYIVNAAFGRADLTRKITVAPGATTSEKFVLNAGGLRVKALVGGAAPAANTVSYDIYSGERDQSDNRTKIVGNLKPDVVIRLNAGIYRIVSTYGDANAEVEADVTVEAGKLSEATVTHAAARVTFKLVAREGGEALPDTQWTLQTADGEVVKRSVGALPTHILAPGTYTVVAKSGARAFKRDFTVADGDTSQVEVLMR